MSNEEKFVVIRRSFTESGLFSYFFTSLTQIRYALEMGFVPIIDLQTNYYTFLHEADEVGRVNMWDRFFSQYHGYTLEDAVNAKSVTYIEDIGYNSKYPISFDNFLDLSDDIAVYKKIISTHVGLNSDTSEYVNEIFKRVIPKNSKVLGVNYRESYARRIPKGHCIQPDLTKVTHDIDSAISNAGFTHIYLATEDHAVIRHFQNVYGDKLLFVQRPRVNQYENFVKIDSDLEALLNSTNTNWGNNNKNIESINFNRPRDKFTKAREYISEMYILSKCDGLIGPVTNGLAYAYLIKKTKYEFEKIYSDVY